MASDGFKCEVFRTEVVVHHVKQSHTYRFRILSRGLLGLRGNVIEPNMKAKRGARGYLMEAYAIARAALEGEV
jgi:hypothetical protein